MKIDSWEQVPHEQFPLVKGDVPLAYYDLEITKRRNNCQSAIVVFERDNNLFLAKTNPIRFEVVSFNLISVFDLLSSLQKKT
jgi:hypothetical protein